MTFLGMKQSLLWTNINEIAVNAGILPLSYYKCTHTLSPVTPFFMQKY